ncbi:EAL domain-containing protein [uncultured Massilia sp.]|uniref:sensor domain-containing protein n=1 Tax=uncultured Massilia sp. TaxID=169973 RepID=UPI0025F21488|nr:EAL domain-containing protein [uncultured Massilia sp.]
MHPSPLPLAVFVVDATGTVTDWNPACEKLAGYTASDIRGSRIGNLIDVDDEAGAAPRALAQREAETTGSLACVDGRRIPVRIIVAPHSYEKTGSASYSVIVVPRKALAPGRPGLVQDLAVDDIIEGLPCVFYVIDRSGHLLLWNRQLEEALQVPSAAMPSLNVKRFFDPATRPTVVCNIMAAFEHGESTHEADLVGRQGKRTSFLFHCARTSLGSLPCVFGTGLDISARKQSDKALRLRERALTSSVNAIVITCRDRHEHHIEYVNPAFEHLTGYTLAEIKGRDPRFMRVPGCDVEEGHRISAALRRQQSVRALLRNARKDGTIFWNDLRIDPVAAVDGEVTHFVAVISDVTEARHYERRLQHLAHHDPLTGLANRALLQERLAEALAASTHGGGQGALAFLDLDNFKHVNDTFGHEAGDAVLRAIATRLRENTRDDDTVARVGGDEFVLVIRDQPGLQELADLVERVRAAVALPVAVGGQEILPGASIGVAVFPRDGATPDLMMRAADAAMYHAKALGRNNVQFYSAALNQAVHLHLQFEASLQRALGNGELALDYQPKVDLRSGRVVGAEALIRWRHPQQGLVGPDRFIPVAEQTGLIVPIGEWAIAEACRTLRDFHAEGIEGLVIAVNLSARQLRQRQFVARLAAILAHHGVDPHCLELEVTESQLMDSPRDAQEALEGLKRLGVRLSIDDFGTGYSSLSHLQQFPVDTIKIDRSFLGSVQDDGHAVITRAIIALGHNLRLEVVAEGVETREQLRFLRAHHCDQMQGYYFSPGLPREGLRDLLRRGTRLGD